MTKFNPSFDLVPADVELIEGALRYQKQDLAAKHISMAQEDGDARDCANIADLVNTIAEIHDLLGRLHTQKVFFRPATRRGELPYVSG